MSSNKRQKRSHSSLIKVRIEKKVVTDYKPYTIRIDKKEVTVDEADYNSFQAVCSSFDSEHRPTDSEPEFEVDENDEGKRIRSLRIAKKSFERNALPSEVERLAALKTLRADNSHIASIPPSIKVLQNLEELHLGCNILPSLPPEIGQLINLKVLDVSSNPIDSLPASIGKLKKLQELNINATEISEFPEVLRELPALRELDISGCHWCYEEFYAIPDLQQLEVIRIHYDDLESIPEEIGQLSNLKVLDMPGNYISKLPSFGQLKKLEVVNLHAAHLRKLPKEFWGLTALRELDLLHTKVKIPKSIKRLKNLEVLSLSIVKSLPEEFGSLKKLRRLCLNEGSDNITFPRSMKNLQQLEYLSVKFLRMSLLDGKLEFIRTLKNLKRFYCPREDEWRAKRQEVHKYMMDLVKDVPYLYEVGFDPEDERPELSYALECNRFKGRSPFASWTKGSPSFLNKLWPRILSNPTSGFDRRPLGARASIEPHEAVYKLLVYGRESFVQVVQDRSIGSIDNSKSR